MDFMSREEVRFTLDLAATLDAETLAGMIDEIDDDVMTNGDKEEELFWFDSVARDTLLLELCFKRPAAGQREFD